MPRFYFVCLALEIERNRQVDIRNQLEMMAKKERVRRIRAERSKSDIGSCKKYIYIIFIFHTRYLKLISEPGNSS